MSNGRSRITIRIGHFGIIPAMNETSSDKFSILVIRLGALGDVANTIRAVQAARRAIPAVRIDWLVEAASRDLVEASGVADRVILFPRKRLARLFSRPWRWPAGCMEALRFLRKELRASRYDAALDFQGNLKSGVLSLFSRAGVHVGFARGHCREMNWFFNNVLATPSKKRLPRVEKFAALAQVVAPDLKLDGVSVKENPEAAAWVKNFLETVEPGEGPLVVLHPGTSDFGAFKRWPPENFGAVAATLRQSRGARCIVTQGPGEDELAESVVAASGGFSRKAPLMPIPQLIELLRRADVVIAGDTGPLHIAALLERPVVGIFAAKDPVIYAPYGTRCEIVRADVECSPCTKRRCEDLRCIHQISVEMVADAAEKLLD